MEGLRGCMGGEGQNEVVFCKIVIIIKQDTNFISETVHLTNF